MKILPVSFYNYLPKLNQPKMTLAQPADTFSLSFNGYVDPGMDSDEIHCPCCGQKMLSQDRFYALVKKASKVKNTGEFIDFLEEYKDYIPINMKNIYALSQRESFREKPFNEFVQMQAEEAKNSYYDSVKSIIANLKDYGGNLSDLQQEAFALRVNSIKPSDNLFNIKQNLLAIAQDLELEGNEKHSFLSSLLTPIKYSNEYSSVFSIADKENLPTGNLAKILAIKIFSKSLITKTRITKIKELDSDINEILVCSSCDKNSTVNSFLHHNCSNDPNFKKYIIRYLEDVSAAIVDKNEPLNSYYIKKLFDFVSGVTRRKITFSEFEFKKLINLNHALSRHEIFTPISQTAQDIHCAGCSAIMMPHKIRKEFENDLENSDTLLEYAAVINKYSKYIGPYSKDLAREFLTLVIEDPSMDFDEFLSRLQEKIDAISLEDANIAVGALKNSYKYYRKNGSVEEITTLNKVLDRVVNYMNHNKFNNFVIRNFFDEIFEGINLDNNCPPSVYDFMTRIKKVGYINTLAKPNEFDALNDKNQIHTIVYNIFKPDFATADHLVAKCKDGEDTKNNLIGLCKACNTIVKNRKGVPQWLRSDPRVKYNIRVQLNDVDALSQKGIIEGYEDWSDNICNTILHLTNGKVDLRNLDLNG